MTSPCLVSRADLIAPAWGGPLKETDYANLLASWITREIADAAMLRRVDSFDGRGRLGRESGTVLAF